MKSLEGANDEIKNDYCQLAAEKETIERHYENLESKLKSMNASKNSSAQDSVESLKRLQVHPLLVDLLCRLERKLPVFRMNWLLQRRNWQKRLQNLI